MSFSFILIYFHRLRTLEAEQEHLRLKQARLTKFASKEERDNWINAQIRDITENLTIRQNQLNLLIEEKKAGEEEMLFKTQAIDELKEKNMARFKLRQELENEEFTLKTERDEATEERKNLWREEAKLDTLIRNYSDEIRKAERTLSSTIDRVSFMMKCWSYRRETCSKCLYRIPVSVCLLLAVLLNSTTFKECMVPYLNYSTVTHDLPLLSMPLLEQGKSRCLNLLPFP